MMVKLCDGELVCFGAARMVAKHEEAARSVERPRQRVIRSLLARSILAFSAVR
jgi:hypothetical protein